ncbi:MAG: pyridoxal-dependent decarboxylase [Acidimicrobiia bacterium]
MQRPERVGDLNWSETQARDFVEMTAGIWTELVDRLEVDLPVARGEDSKSVRTAIALDVPSQPLDLETIEKYLREFVFEHSMYPGHPGFLAYVSGAGTVPGAAADLLASGLNQNTGGWRLSPAATELENYLGEWFAHKMGLPKGSGGFMVSGGAMANLVGVQLARLDKAGWDVRENGLLAGPQLVIYVSTETHVTVDRAAEISGLGRAGVRHIGTDAELRMDVAELRSAIEADLDAGNKPIAVVATAGTTGTGSIDPLGQIADICEEFDLWMHVDAAYGGAAALTRELAPLFSGIERARSVGFDPHKWLYTPIAGACVLVRDFDMLHDAFGLHASYIVEDPETTGWGNDMAYLTPNFTRPFSALKVWVSFLAHGWDAYERRIAHDVELTRYLEHLVGQEPELELISPQRLSIATFRYRPPELASERADDPYLNRLNERIMFDLEFEGNVYPSNAVVDGRFAIRSCIVNFRTEAEQMETLVADTVRFGRLRHSEMWSRPA